ncbi:MAG: helicase-related protein, partial [Polyangia bacterium]
MTFAPGALVRARGREWVVLPESAQDLLVLRPLGGTDEEVAGVYLPLETVEPATFPPPSVDSLGDHASCRLLRDAVRLGFRSSSGPFRSFAQLAVEPRPYQLVPLLMAMRQDVVRLLIADDVGIGKTIEAGLIARELLDRGEAKRLVVLCPPPLAEQWQQELSRKFHIETELVLASTAPRLERHCAVGQSLFELHKYVVVSTDFIKSDRRRDDFLRACPDLVIVDEAHTCAFDGGGGTGRHQRHQLLKGLAADPNRHLILVTATPHSGKETAFRSLLALLRPEFAALPETLAGAENEKQRRELAQYVVQRRRGDLKQYLDTTTPFPKREELEETYDLSLEYRALFKRVLSFARETVQNAQDGTHRQRIRWWAALGLLRSLASSPAAAAMTLRNRAEEDGTDSNEAADEIGRRTIMDQEGDEAVETVDVAPGSQTEEDGPQSETRRQLLSMADEADALCGAKDEKLKRIVALLKKLVLEDDYHPIVFCRFIPTAGYLAEHLRKHLKGVTIEAVTGQLAPSEREQRVLQLAQSSKRLLVATDCLSEGVNLQDHFDAVVHYDLAWNPTRHEQREGRVDRYGQNRGIVRVLTRLTRDKWLLPLFKELDYGLLAAAHPYVFDEKAYPASHEHYSTLIHLVGFRQDLDKRAATTSDGPKMSPHGLVQELLNRSKGNLWAFVSNGLQLRILRDSAALTRQSFVEFDLESMLRDEVYPDFVLFWMLCHASRVRAERPEECWLEKWSKAAQAQGTRALDQLRDGVEKAITALGQGFLQHPENRDLRAALERGALT